MARPAIKTADELLAYVKRSINTYFDDPPSNDYQRGHVAALYEVKKFLTEGR